MNTAFLAFANNYNNRLPNLKEESDQVYKILFDNNKNDFNIVREEFAHSSTVIDKIRRIDKKLKVFLFSGHANSEKLLMDADSAIYIEGFAPILPPNIPLVILNGCSTAGKVTSLIEAGAKVVIATSSAISDRKATDFSITFFEQFVGNKKSIKDSFDDAIKVTQVKNGQISERIDRGALNSNYRNSKNAHLPVWGLYYNKENEGYIQEKFADVIKPEFSYLKNKKFIYGLLLVLIGLGYWLLTSLNSPDTRLETRDIFTYLSLYKNNVKVEEYKFENINPFKNNLTNKNFEVATKDSLYYLVNKGLKVDDKPYNFLFPCNKEREINKSVF